MSENITCANCKHSRQIANKARPDIVGCVAMTKGLLKPDEVKSGTVYLGYIYGGRRPGDIADSAILGKGALTWGLLIDADGECKLASKLDNGEST